MSDYFLNYLLAENSEEFANDLLTYINWSQEEKSKYQYPSTLDFNNDDLKLFTDSKTANEIISKLYFEDNDLLFLIVYTQRIIHLSRLKEVFTYNMEMENPEFDYDPDIHEHIYLSDVEVFMTRTKNKIFVFCNSNYPDQHFKPFVITAHEALINGHEANKLFDRLGIKNKRNFETLSKKIESFYKKKIK